MNSKTKVLISTLLSTVSVSVFAAEPPTPPSMYSNGPTSFQVSRTDLSAAERGAYALYESVMQVAEARIRAQGCSSSVGTFSVSAFTNGSVNSPIENEIVVASSGGVGSFTLQATLASADTFRGQKLKVAQVGNGSLKGTSVRGFKSDVSFNAAGTMMVADAAVSVVGVNNRFDAYQGKVIKDFYRDANPAIHFIYDWGLQSLSKLGYPEDKYWQRSISQRDDGFVGRTVFVKDRLVGPTACRIVLNTSGSNNVDFFSQSGDLIISTAKPGDAAPDLSIADTPNPEE